MKIPPNKQAPASRPNLAVRATAKLAVKSTDNGNNNKSSSSQSDGTPTLPAATGKEKQQRISSIDKISDGNQTLAQEKVLIGLNANASDSEVKPKKKTKKVLKLVKKVVKKRVPKSSLKSLAACSNTGFASIGVLDDGGEKISGVSVQEAGILEDKGLEKQEEVVDCMTEREVEMITSSVDAPCDIEKSEGLNISLQESDGFVKEEASVREIPVESEKEEAFVRDIPEKGEKEEASVSEIPLEGEKGEAFVCEIPVDGEKGEASVNGILVDGDKGEASVSGILVDSEKREASVREIPVDSEKGEASVCGMPMEGEKGDASVSEIPVHSEKEEASVSEIQVDAGKTESVVKKSDSTSETPMELVNADSVGDRDQSVGESSGCEGMKDDNVTSNGRIILSGELEALERKRRRRTEIFIGGLNTDAKEEDVRKVFETVGDIVEMRLVINIKTGRNKGYAFVRYASAMDAKKALEKYSNVEICGKQCATAPVDGNDTIFLGNIDRNWKKEDVIRLLQEIGIEKIDTVTLMADPTNVERNRGFAFLELETYKDAQIAFKKLQKKDLGKLRNIKVAWAEPISEPDEEELLKVKAVYAEYLPPSWNEEKIRSFFVKFGEIETVVLSRNLHSSRRKDFAFINFTTREAALACIESFNHETLHDEGSQVNVKVSLAKPVPKGKPQKKVSKPTSKEISRQRQPNNFHAMPVDARSMVTPLIHVVNQRQDDMRPAVTSELEQLLAERALRKQMQARMANEDYTRTMANEEYTRQVPGHKRLFSALGDDLNFSDPRGYTRTRFESSFPVGRVSHGEVPSGFGMTSYYQQQRADHVLGQRYSDYANSFQREEAPYRGSGSGSGSGGAEYRRY
ncbi:RNA-binding protein 47 [Euphorbia peplus]|nr:RNA-binding protein 47 [Euphorbia peplus]